MGIEHSVVLRYSFYDRVECVRLCPIEPDKLFRHTGRPQAVFAESPTGTKAFEVNVQTADICVRRPV